MPINNQGHRDTRFGDDVLDSRQVPDRFARMEDLLFEMRFVQDLQLKKMKRLEALVEELAEPIARRRATVTASLAPPKATRRR